MFAGMGAGHQRLPRLERSPFLNCQMPWQMPDVALSRRKQGFESPRERQPNQRLIITSPVGVQRLSNKRLRTGMDDRAQTPPRFIGDSTWMSRTGSRPNRLGSVSSPV